MIDISQALEFFEERHDTSLLPYSIVTDSDNLGPHLIIVGATHGNETVGVRAIMDYITHLESNTIKLKKGKITWILGNPEAFREGKRFLHMNMNRAFNALLDDHTEHQRVREIRRYFNHVSSESNLDLLIDLHSVSIGDFKIAICLSDKPDNYSRLNSLTALQSRFTCTDAQLPGSFMQEAEDFGGFGMALECGNHTDPESSHTALWHINKALIEYDMIHQQDLLNVAPLPQPESIIRFECIEPIKPDYDFEWLIPLEDVHTGSKLRRGQTYASYRGGAHTAPEDCVLFVPDPKPHPEDIDAGFIANLSVTIPEFYPSESTKTVASKRKQNHTIHQPK